MKNVLVIDSGSGAVNILKECVRVCPHCNFLVFCDQKNLPYGSKSAEQLQEIAMQNLNNIRKFFRFEIVVLACNTLTCTVLERVRREFSGVTFIGTVPAIKPALGRFAAQDILVLATPVTLSHNILISKTSGLQLLPMQNLASEIDQNLGQLHVLRRGLERELANVNAKAVVLGCTHYIALKEMIADILRQNLGQEVEVFDSANGVARRLKHFVVDGGEETEKIGKQAAEKTGEQAEKNARVSSDKEKQRCAKAGENYQVQFVTSGDEKMLPLFWQHFMEN